MIPPTAVLKEAVEAFLYQEARLADESRHDEWLALWTPDIMYWIPTNIDDYDPDEHVSIIYDDRERLEDRIARLKSGGAWAQEPQSRMRRAVSNVEIVSSRTAGEFEVRSNFILGELRRGRQTVYFAHQKHRLRTTADGLKMCAKTILLINNDEPIHNLSFIV